MQHQIIESVKSIYISLDSEKLLDRVKLEVMLGQLLWEPAEGVLVMRCKGKLLAKNDQGQTAVYVMQGVGALFEIREVELLQDAFEPKFLFVGRGLEKDKLKSDLNECTQ